MNKFFRPMASQEWTFFAGFASALAAIALAAIVAVSRAQAPAQQTPPERIQVTIIQVKPDMQTTWEDLQKNEMIPAQKKAGLPWRDRKSVV